MILPALFTKVISLLAIVLPFRSYGFGFIKNTDEFLLYTSILPELYNNCGNPELPVYTSEDTTKTAESLFNSFDPTSIGCIIIFPVFITVAIFCGV